MKLKFNRLSRQTAVTTARSFGLVFAGALALSAAVAEAAPPPPNHIYVSTHGWPTYKVLIREFVGEGQQFGGVNKNCVGPCKISYEYKFIPGQYNQGIEVNITPYGRAKRTFLFHYSTTSRDHCILVKANGTVYSTGDNTTGCHKP